MLTKFNKKLTGIFVVWGMFILLVFTPMKAWSAVTFGTITGPTPSGGNWVFSVPVTAMSSPDNSVCIQVFYNKGSGCDATGTVYGPVFCPRDGGGSGPGTYTCTIPYTSAGSYFTYDIASYASAGGSCGSEKTQAPAPFDGSTCQATTPTAVSFSSADAIAPVSPSWLIPIMVAVLLALTQAFYLFAQTRTPPQTSQ
jgi:hypothetical protein